MTTDRFEDGEARVQSHWTRICRGPSIAAAFIICSINSFDLVRLVRADAPRNPWEATEVLEAWRSLLGKTVYELTISNTR